MKPYCNDLEDFDSLSIEIGEVPASYKLNCTLYDYSEFGTKYLPSESVNVFGFNIISVISDFGLINLIGVMMVVIFIRSGK
jgi:hypothetical protein